MSRSLLLMLSFLIIVVSGCGPYRQFEACRNPQCGTCKGHGNFRCSNCFGTGHGKCPGNMFMAACDGGTISCRTCNGGGMYLSQQCYNCNGRGRKNCTECGGTARALCKNCGGDGMADCGRWVVIKEK